MIFPLIWPDTLYGLPTYFDGTPLAGEFDEPGLQRLTEYVAAWSFL